MPKRKNPVLTSQKILEPVRRAYRQDLLARTCTLPEDRFGPAYSMETISVEQGWPHDYYHFRDNGSRVLATAHLDTVVRPAGRKPHFRDTKQGPFIQSGALDDRLGAYVILHLLPVLGIKPDVLLTVGEESGMSTAEFFKAGKDYDWVIEFDRGGTDVVMYQYEDTATCALVEAAGAEVGFGSYSDIAYLEHLNVKAFNWGVGYGGNYHSEAGYAYLEDTFAMVAKYLRFHEQNAGTTLPHEPKKTYGYRSGRSYLYDDYYLNCEYCETKESVDSVTGYCLYCGACQDCGGKQDIDCMCYVPSGARNEAEQAGAKVISITTAKDKRDWTEMTWDEYCELRPGKSDYDDVLCAKCSLHVVKCECEGTIAEWRVKLPYDQVCVDCGNFWDECSCKPLTGQSRDPHSPSLAPPWSEHRVRQDGSLAAEVTAAHRNLGRREAPLPVFKAPDEMAGWHEAVWVSSNDYVMAHAPNERWAGFCLRCAARWPHPVAELTAGEAGRS